jgi:hypothetical protein
MPTAARLAIYAAIVALLLTGTGCAGCGDQSGLSPPTPPVEKSETFRRRPRNWRPSALGPLAQFQKREGGAPGGSALIDGGVEAGGGAR